MPTSIALSERITSLHIQYSRPGNERHRALVNWNSMHVSNAPEFMFSAERNCSRKSPRTLISFTFSIDPLTPHTEPSNGCLLYSYRCARQSFSFVGRVA